MTTEVRDERQGAGPRAQVMGAPGTPSLFGGSEVPYLDHVAFIGELGLHQVLEPDTETVMQEFNERSWREDAHDSPHQHAWHTAFHASEFPGRPADACARYLVYRMMNFPSGEGALPPWVTTTATVGSAIEDDIVRAWHASGRLLSAAPDDEYQTYFEDPEVWLTASTDMTVLKPFWTKSHVTEIKCKADDVVREMNTGQRKWDPQHRHQLLTSLGAAHRAHTWKKARVCQDSWRLATMREDIIPAYICREHGGVECLIEIDLDPPDTGSIYYVSRSWPRGNPRDPTTKPVEFFFNYDHDFMERGRDVLRVARAAFEADQIPDRPSHFAWSIGPCQRCPMKKFACKPDQGKRSDTPVTTLSQSNGVEYARSVRPAYDPKLVRETVLGRWSRG